LNRTSEQIYDSAQRRHPLVEELLILIQYRDLLRQFIISSIKVRYKRSLLGIIWTLLNPLLTMLVLTLVFSNVFRITIQHYPAYALSGLIIWNFFANTTSISMQGLISSGGLLNRIYVPKSIFTVSAIGSELINLTLSLIPLFAIALVIGMKIEPAVLVMPLAVILLVIFALGVGLILATAAVYFADIVPFYSVILTLWMYSTPIIYPPEILPSQFAWILKFNPMYYFVMLFRRPLYEGTVPPLNEWLLGALFALSAFIIGGLIFTAKSKEYAYRA
jgi:ABC-2 type transport system permease protein